MWFPLFPYACLGSGERSAEDVAYPGSAVQLRGAGEPTGRVLRGPLGPNGLRRGHLPVSHFILTTCTGIMIRRII